MKIIINLGEGVYPCVCPDRARVAFDGMMSIYEHLPRGVLEALEMAQFSVKEDVKEDVQHPFTLEVTICKKMQGSSSRKHIDRDFSVDMIEAAMLAAVSELMDGLVSDARQRQASVARAFPAFFKSSQVSSPGPEYT